MKRRKWIRIDELCVELYYGKKPIDWLCRRLGRPHHQVYQKARAMGLARAYRWPQLDMEAIVRDRNAQGWSDTEIAAECKVERHAVSRLRRELGLPSNAHSQRVRKKIAATTRRQLDRLGLAQLKDLQ